MPNPSRRRVAGGLSAISIPHSPNSYTSSLSSPNSGHSLSPSLSPLVSAHSFKRQRSAESSWDSQTASTDDDREGGDREDSRRRRRQSKKAGKVLISPLTVGMGLVSVKDGGLTPTTAAMPPFSLSASSAFLPLAPSLSPSSSAISITRSASHIPGVFLSGHATVRAPSPSYSPTAASISITTPALHTSVPSALHIPQLHPLAFHPLNSPTSFSSNAVYLTSPTVRFSAPHSVPVVPLAPPTSSTMLFMPSPLAASSTLSPFFSTMPPGAVPLSHSANTLTPQPLLSPQLSQVALPTFASSSVAALLPQPGSAQLTSSSTLSTPFPWSTERRSAGGGCRRYLLHFPDDSSHGAQNGLYQPGKPSELVVRMKRRAASNRDEEGGQGGDSETDGECETCEVKLPVKIALKPTVKESATVRRFDELALHPAAFYTQSSDLAWEERNFCTSAEHSEPAFLLLRQDWKNPIALVHVARYGRQQRECDELSPLHLLPTVEGSLAHTQTRGRGKTLQQRLETAQLYLSLCVGKAYELRAHSGWRVDGVEMRHFKGGRQVQCVDMPLRELGVGASNAHVAAAIAAESSGSSRGGKQVRVASELSDGSGGRQWPEEVKHESAAPVGGSSTARARVEALMVDYPLPSAPLHADVEAAQLLLGALSQPQLVAAS